MADAVSLLARDYMIGPEEVRGVSISEVNFMGLARDIGERSYMAAREAAEALATLSRVSGPAACFSMSLDGTAFERLIEDSAEQRARDYLIAHLSDGQRGCLERHGWFTVRNQKSGRRWRIHTNTTAFNVELIDEWGTGIEWFCAAPADGRLPASDVHLAQKLMLEADDEGFLRVANTRMSMLRHFETGVRLAAL